MKDLLAFQEPNTRKRLPTSACRVHIEQRLNEITNSSIIPASQVYEGHGLECGLERFAQVPKSTSRHLPVSEASGVT